MNKVIKILSPLTIIAVLLVDLSVISATVFAIIKLIESINALSILFTLMDIFAIIIAILISKEVFSNRIVFNKTNFEFIGLDNDNKYEYSNIEKIEFNKDDKASFKKNFNDRHAMLILYLRENKIASIDLGLITKNRLVKIVKEIESRKQE